ncbi:MAG: MFS transporter, partial [Deltaproteobacteria bacterium]|nr:MFS transporter [Deltaproteobacteria bacterium]
MASLIVAGEAVFVLPYYVTRFFRPTFLDVFEFTNTELGQAQAVYGVVAMVAYFPGGPLADRFPARNLLAASLALTAAGGLYMATIPGFLGMAMLWGFWGCTSILLLWAALIRATREWGGPEGQGAAFGILDGGRGLAGALMAAAAAQALQLLMPIDAAAATLAQQTEALQGVILTFSAATFAAALVVWFGIPTLRPSGADPSERGA